MRPMIAATSISCGCRQLSGLHIWNRKHLEKRLQWGNDYTEADVITRRRSIFDGDNGNCTPMMGGYTYIFSDNEGSRNGKQLAAFIKQEKLGDLTEHGPVRNPNSGNKIRTWVWTWNGKIPEQFKVNADTDK